MIVFGTRHYGKVDEIEGLGFVKTRFAHIWFLPLLPLGSMWITEETHDGVRGLKVPLSIRSVAATWGRTWIFFAILGSLGAVAFAGIGLLEVILNGSGVNAKTLSEAGLFGGALVAGGFGVLFHGLAWWAIGRFLGRASDARKAEIFAMLGIESVPQVAALDAQPPDNDPFLGGARLLD